ncbi:MAG: hypothetical protein K8R87_07285 [Verrucomicrobia bacterium]|nr:hypothetical protein [Verrucomicrobiota bacterium]
MKKKLLRILMIVLVLFAGTMVGLRTWVTGWVNRPKLIAEMEAGWNCRAELKSTSLSFFSSPAKVVLGGLYLAPRDEEVARPLKERSAFDPATALLSAGRIELTVSLSDLLRRKASISRLRIDDFNLRDEIDEEGDGLLDYLFEKPDAENAPETTAYLLRNLEQCIQPWQTPASTRILAPAQALSEGESKEIKPGDTKIGGPEPKPKLKKKRSKKKKEHKPFKASDLRLALAAEEASVENGRVELLDLGQQTRILFEHVRLAFKDVDVAPDDLAHHNVCSLELSADIKLEKTDVAQTLVNCSLTGTGTIKPFDVESGEWNPDISLEPTVRKGSLLGGTLMKDQMRSKDAQKLKEYGIDLGDVALGGVLCEDVSTEVHLAKGKLIVKKDTRLVFPDYEIALEGGSWFHGRSDSHIARGELVVGTELSAKILAQAQKSLAVKYGETLAGLAAQAAMTVLQDDKKRLVIKFKSKGKLSKPEITWDNPLNDVKDILKNSGADLLNGLLGK